MRKNNYRKIVVEEAREKLRMRFAKDGGIGFWLSYWIITAVVVLIIIRTVLGEQAVKDYAFETFVLSFIPGTIHILLLYLNWVFLGVPEEIFERQKKALKLYQNKELKLSVLQLRKRPIIKYGNTEVPQILIKIKSHEKKKITELRAKTVYLYQHSLSSEKNIHVDSYTIDQFLTWQDGRKEISLRPDDDAWIQIANLTDDLLILNFGSKKISDIILNVESILICLVEFWGKLEQENEFRDISYDIELYYHPKEKILDTLFNISFERSIQSELFEAYKIMDLENECPKRQEKF